jgi:translation initiation factor 2B subunit (eIF-2B alpha/beta/delta family)
MEEYPLDQEKVNEVRAKMVQALLLIKEAVDLSLTLVKYGEKESMRLLWEDFIKEFIRYIKKKSRETGINLISLISFSRIIG